MPRNGSGTYSAPSNTWNPATTGTTVSSSDWNSVLTDLETALTNSIAKDGQTTITANLPMATYKHTGVGDATTRDQYASMGQLQDNKGRYLTSVSGTDTITATASFSMTAYAAGQSFVFIAAGTNTGAATININSIGAKDIQKNGAALAAGDITANDIVHVVYDGTQFQMVSPARTPVLTNGSISTAAIADSAITTVKINNDAVTTAKIADSNVTKAKIENLTDYTVLGNVSGSAAAPAEVSILDEDDMSSDSATALATQQSIKAYVDSSGFTEGTKQATTSGTAFDFTGIASGTKMIIVGLDSVSLDGTNNFFIQIGDSGGIETSGYESRSGNSGGDISKTGGFGIFNGNASYTNNALLILTLIDSTNNTWMLQGVNDRDSSTAPTMNIGIKSLSGELDRLRLTRDGSDNFDGGAVNILTF